MEQAKKENRFENFQWRREAARLVSAVLFFGAVTAISVGLIGAFIVNDSTANEVHETTDKSEGGHNTWDWIVVVSLIAMCLQVAQVFFDFFVIMPKERAYRRGTVKNCAKLLGSIRTWTIIFIVVHFLLTAWHVINMVHSALRLSDSPTDAATVYYTAVIIATTLAIVGGIVMIIIYLFSLRRVRKACAPMSMNTSASTPLVVPHAGSGVKTH